MTPRLPRTSLLGLSGTTMMAMTTAMAPASLALSLGMAPLLRMTLVVALLTGLPALAGLLLQPLPAYSVAVQVDRACMLCGVVEQPISTVIADRPLDIAAHPQRPVSGPVFLHVYLGDRGTLRPTWVWAAQGRQGSLHLRGLAREILNLDPGDQGPRELWILVTRMPLPPTLAALRVLRALSDSSQLSHFPIVLQREPAPPQPTF
jgi:hypothetical protein